MRGEFREGRVLDADLFALYTPAGGGGGDRNWFRKYAEDMRDACVRQTRRALRERQVGDE